MAATAPPPSPPPDRLFSRADAFAQAWVYAGHDGDLAAPGSFFAAQVGPVPVLVTRDEEGRVRALRAICRHQGAAIRVPAGTGSSVRCAYHGWVYGLDGTLRAAPGAGREEGFDPAAHGLPQLPVGAWGPFVFAAADAAAPPLDDVLAGMPERIAATGIDVGALRFHRRTRSRYAAGWEECLARHQADARPDSPAHLLPPATTVTVHPAAPGLTIGALAPAGAAATQAFADHFFTPGADPNEVAAVVGAGLPAAG